MVKKIHDTRITSLHTVIFLKNMPYPMMCFPEGSHWHQTSSAWSHCVLLNISKCHCQRSALVILLWHNSNSACEGLRRVSHWMVDQLPSRYVTSSSTWNRQKSRCCKRIQGQWVNHYIYILSIDMISLWFCHCQPRFPKNKAELGWACSWHIHQHLVLNSDTEKLSCRSQYISANAQTARRAHSISIHTLVPYYTHKHTNTHIDR